MVIVIVPERLGYWDPLPNGPENGLLVWWLNSPTWKIEKIGAVVKLDHETPIIGWK